MSDWDSDVCSSDLGGGERLKGETDAELLGHVGFGAIVEIGLDGAGSEHHVEAEIADLGHVAQHDLVAALGHDGEVGAGLVRPHAEAKETEPQPFARFLAAGEVAPGLGTRLVKSLKLRAGELQLAGGLETDGPVRPRQRDGVAALDQRLPLTAAGEGFEEIASAAGTVIGMGAEPGP